jgi:iron complex transport system substrate-binding protein
VRIVSLACSNTEIVCALGLGSCLVGVDDHSDHPPEVVERLPRVGPDLSIDVQRVTALKPDVVLASMTLPGHERVVEQIAQTKIPYVAPDPWSLQDVYRDVRDIGALLGRSERAEQVVAEMEAALLPRAPTGCRVLVEWWPKPVIVPGRKSWVTDLITLAGGVNPWGQRDQRSLPLRDEDVLDSPPDVVAISWCGVPLHRYRLDVVTRRPRWSEVPAVVRGQVVPITEAWLGRPGPRLVQGYRALCSAIDAAS